MCFLEGVSVTWGVSVPVAKIMDESDEALPNKMQVLTRMIRNMKRAMYVAVLRTEVRSITRVGAKLFLPKV